MKGTAIFPVKFMYWDLYTLFRMCVEIGSGDDRQGLDWTKGMIRRSLPLKRVETNRISEL